MHWTTRPHIPKPNVMLGNMNIVKESIDQLSAHTDPANTVKSLIILKSYLDIVDE